VELGMLLGSGTYGLFDGSEDGMPVGRALGVMLRPLEGCELGTLLGAGDFVGGAESKLLGFCDGWELGTLLGAGDLDGAKKGAVLGWLLGFSLGSEVGSTLVEDADR
jgi:hypothetical protein